MMIPILKGAWLAIATPTISLLAVVLGEKYHAPGPMIFVVIFGAVFGGFGLLIRSQFARRGKNSDVAASFILSEVIGIGIVVALLLIMRH